MPVTNNNLPLIDLPTWEVLQPQPAAAAVGASACNDTRGTNRFVYLLISATSFWRYATWANSYQQLASLPGGTVGAGTTLTFDPSRGAEGYVWALISNGSVAPTWQYYDVAANSWTARSVTGLPGTFGTDADLVHTCSTHHAAGNDDYLYLIGNNATTFYRYSVVGNSWSTLTAVTAAPGAGCALHWLPAWDPNLLVCLRGAASATVYSYSIVGNNWSPLTYTPATETLTTGTVTAARGLGSKIVVQKDVTGRMFELDVATGKMTPLATQYLITPGTGHVGDRLVYVKDANGIEFVYFGLPTATHFLRTALFF